MGTAYCATTTMSEGTKSSAFFNIELDTKYILKLFFFFFLQNKSFFCFHVLKTLLQLFLLL